MYLFVDIFNETNFLESISKNVSIQTFSNILLVGDDLLPGTDRRTDGRTKKHVTFKDAYRHLVNALAI
jgi:hypothetical protein